MRIEREGMLKRLKLVSLGISTHGVIDQSNCFIFSGGRVAAFNDEILVRAKVPGDFEGAVSADELISLLEKFPDDEIEMIQDEDRGQLCLKGARRKAGIPLQNEIHLSLGDVPKPSGWAELPTGVFDHLQNAARVCGKDDVWNMTTCIHMTPDLVEACDNHRLFRIEIETGVSEEIFLSGSSVYALNSLCPSKVAAADGWCHFRVPGGVVSIRCRDSAEYPDLEKLCDVDGTSIRLPAVLKPAIARARITSEGVGNTTRISVTVQKDYVTIQSRSGKGWYKERVETDYTGPRLAFDVHPDLLVQILDRSREVVVDDKRMGGRLGDAQFVIALMSPSE